MAQHDDFIDALSLYLFHRRLNELDFVNKFDILANQRRFLRFFNFDNADDGDLFTVDFFDQIGLVQVSVERRSFGRLYVACQNREPRRLIQIGKMLVALVKLVIADHVSIRP
ncbi:hypothetical protein D1872_257470 [compost metagenome]